MTIILSPEVDTYEADHQSNLATHTPEKLIKCICIGASTVPIPGSVSGATFFMGGASKYSTLVFSFAGVPDEEWEDTEARMVKEMPDIADEAMKSLGEPPQWFSIHIPLPLNREICAVAVSTGHVGIVGIDDMTRAMKFLAFAPALDGPPWPIVEAAAKHCWGTAWEGSQEWATAG